MSLNQLAELSRRSFLTYRTAMNVAGDNIAGANTEGFARRRLTLRSEGAPAGATWSALPPRTATGAGVSVAAYERVRDHLLLTTAWEGRAALGAAEEQERLMATLEGLLPSGTAALGSQLDAFWGSWSRLADRPTSLDARHDLLRQAAGLTTTFQGLDAHLTRLAEETRTTLADGLATFNAHLDRVGALNAAIERARAAGSPDVAAEDERDRLVAALAEFVPLRVQPDAPGGYALSTHGMALVEGSHVTHLTSDGAAAPTLRFAGTSVAFAGTSGRLGAWLETLQRHLPDLRTGLDDLAAGLAAEVNTRHTTGFGLDGATGRAFFGGATAGSLALSADVAGQVEAVAAAALPGAAGDNTLARALADLRATPVFGPDTFAGRAARLYTDVGAAAAAAATDVQAHGAALSHLEALERGVSGVSLDEEMTLLIQHQQAFAASARVLETAREMMDTLLRL